MPVSIRARVLQTPPYTLICYATASNKQSYTQKLKNVNPQFSYEESCLDITIFLTQPQFYIQPGLSQTKKSFSYNVDNHNNNKAQ